MVLKTILIWMRFLWVVAAVIYVVLTLDYRRNEYRLNAVEGFNDGDLGFARMILATFEYAALGLLYKWYTEFIPLKKLTRK